MSCTVFKPASRGNWRFWVHVPCGNVEWFGADDAPDSGGCDGCESGSDDESEWQQLYVKLQRSEPCDVCTETSPAMAYEAHKNGEHR